VRNDTGCDTDQKRYDVIQHNNTSSRCRVSVGQHGNYIANYPENKQNLHAIKNGAAKTAPFPKLDFLRSKTYNQIRIKDIDHPMIVPGTSKTEFTSYKGYPLLRVEDRFFCLFTVVVFVYIVKAANSAFGCPYPGQLGISQRTLYRYKKELNTGKRQ
jgi:hypothetical protein